MIPPSSSPIAGPRDTPTRPILAVRGAAKRFPGVRALDNVDLHLYSSEVLAVVGENGAGKSTLMKTLAGEQPLDAGKIYLDGRAADIDSVATALRLGIALIHQELNLADNLDVAANIFLGREPRRAGPLGLIHRSRIEREAEAILQRVGLDVPPRTLLANLSVGQQQLVEIAKALSTGARILIMDEPTSSLSQRESQRLFDVIRELTAQGVSIIYISHRLTEVTVLADRVVILRDGKNAGELVGDDILHDQMVARMVGRDVNHFYHRTRHRIGAPVFEVCDFRVPARPQHRISFSVCAGEIVGIAGLVGAGRTELLRALFGIDRAVGGKLRISDVPVTIRDPRDAIRLGMALVPEDRKRQGLVVAMNVRENVTLAGLLKFQRARLLVGSRERSTALTMVQRLRVRTPSIEQLVQLLSGGNQQKVALAKWLILEPRILLLDEPTRGIDIGAKEEVYRLIEELASGGMAILFASSELEEILGIADRVLVMHEGRLAGQLQRDELSEKAVMRLATGA